MNKDYFKDKVIIVTGASSGIGLASARLFGSCGAMVVLAARSYDKMQQLAPSVAPLSNVLCVKTDVSCEEDCRHLVEATVARFGRIDILVNNAGISMRAMFKDLDLKVLHSLMDVNFWGTVYAVRGFLDTIRIEHLYDGLHVMVFAPGYTSSNVRNAALTADGAPQGETPLEEDKLMSAEKCAFYLAEGLCHRKNSMILTWLGKATVWARRFFPKFTDRLTYGFVSKEAGSPFHK